MSATYGGLLTATTKALDDANRSIKRHRFDTAVEILIVVGDNPERIHSQAAFAKLAGVAPIPASSGIHQRHRLNRGGHRQLNAAPYRTVIVRMRFHAPTITYVTRRTAEGKTKREIIRCLGRYLAREIYQILITGHTRPLPPALVACN